MSLAREPDSDEEVELLAAAREVYGTVVDTPAGYLVDWAALTKLRRALMAYTEEEIDGIDRQTQAYL